MCTVNLPIIIIRQSRRIILILLFLLVAALLYYFIARHQDTLLLTITIVVSLVLSSFVWMKVPTYQRTGMLTITEDHLTIAQAGNTIAYPLQTVNDLAFRYNGYAGKLYGIKSPYLIDGTDNTIRINDKEYRLLVEWEQISMLNRIFASWRERGLPFELYSSGKRTAKLERLLSA